LAEEMIKAQAKMREASNAVINKAAFDTTEVPTPKYAQKTIQIFARRGKNQNFRLFCYYHIYHQDHLMSS
jgi:hypothetical protein